MPPINNFTTKAKDAIRRAHELAIERGQNHVNPVHLLAALVFQDDSIVGSILDKMEVDSVLLADSLADSIEGEGPTNTVSPSVQMYLSRSATRCTGFFKFKGPR